MISCLIFTKDNADAVIHLYNLVSPYVDEVIVICSDMDCKRKIRDKFDNDTQCQNARVYYRVPKGYVEAYYEEGIALCTKDWIFMLDDDEIPSGKLLRWIASPKHNHKGYLIPRIEVNGNITYIYRLFHADFIRITGTIHRGIIPLRKPDSLLLTYCITHTSKYSAEKSTRFAKIEAEQYPEIIKLSAENCKALKLFYFFVSSIHRVMTAPNKKDTLIYCWHLFKELIK
jgi:hypothetical protein